MNDNFVKPTQLEGFCRLGKCHYVHVLKGSEVSESPEDKEN